MLGPVQVELSPLHKWLPYPHLLQFRLVSHRKIYPRNSFFPVLRLLGLVAVLVQQLQLIYTPRIILLCLLKAIRTHLVATE